jgi:hypothetical protein
VEAWARSLLAIIVLLFVLVFTGVALAQPPQFVGCDEIKPIPLVYTRQPRPSERINAQIEDSANWSHVSDIARIYTFTESDVVLDTGGKIEVIHDCTGVSEICAAQEARVSPDGKRIAYSVSRGTRLMPIMWSGINTKLTEFTSTTAELWLYDIPTKQKRRVSAGHMDRSPDWCGDDCLVFTSDRAGYFPPSAHHGDDYQYKSMQVYRAKVTEGDITDIENLTPHELFALAPVVLHNGDITWSSWQGNYPRKPGTPQNSWSIWAMDSNGANGRAILGMHGGPTLENYELIKGWVDPARAGEGTITVKGLRGCGEIWKGKIACANYYRGNKLGANGNGISFPYRRDAEGSWYLKNIEAADIYRTTPNAKLPATGRFFPSKAKNITPFGESQDANSPKFSKEGRAAGTAGYFAPWLHGSKFYIFNWNRGYCYEALPINMITRQAMGGELTCWKTIRLAIKEVVSNPWTDSIPLACSDEAFHCWDARAVVEYAKLFGQAAPERKPTIPDGKCFLQVVDVRKAEVLGWPGATEQERITWQGNAQPAYSELIKTGQFCITPVSQWTKVPLAGNPLAAVMGFPWYGAKQCQKPEEDGSLRMEVECNQAMLMGAIDVYGNTIATDNATHSLRPGETRTCLGCHVHSEEHGGGRDAAAEFAKTIAGQK